MDNPSVTTSNLSGAAGGIGTILSFIGNMGSAGAARSSGTAAKNIADFEASQLDQNAGQATAAAQRAALDERRRTALLVSRGIAVAAAGGSATNDPGVAQILTQIAGEGEYRSGVAIYQGEEKARQLKMAADVRREEGDAYSEAGAARGRAYTLAGLGGVATGGASLFSKYGQGGPKKAAVSGGGNGWYDAGSTGDFGTVG